MKFVTDVHLLWCTVGLCCAHLTAGQQQGSTSAAWSYNPCASNGPQHWFTVVQPSTGSLPFAACEASLGSRQSPVDLTYVAVDAQLSLLQLSLPPTQVIASNDGKTIRLQQILPGTLTGVAAMVRKGQKIYASFTAQTAWIEVRAPSEHTFAGAARSVELQFVFAITTTGDAVNLPIGRNVVLSSTFVGGSYVSHATWDELLSNGLVMTQAESRASGNARNSSVAFDLMAMLPVSRDYITYEGTWTYPPCSPAMWFVFSNPISIGLLQVAQIRAALGLVDPSLAATAACNATSNDRPVLPVVASNVPWRFVDIGVDALPACVGPATSLGVVEAPEVSGVASSVAALVIGAVALLAVTAIVVVDILAPMREARTTPSDRQQQYATGEAAAATGNAMVGVAGHTGDAGPQESPGGIGPADQSIHAPAMINGSQINSRQLADDD